MSLRDLRILEWCVFLAQPFRLDPQNGRMVNPKRRRHRAETPPLVERTEDLEITGKTGL